MKGFILLLGILIISSKGFAQNNIEVNSPFRFKTTYVGDFVNNTTGGIKKGTRYLGMANIRLTFETHYAGLWDDGILFINAANTHGGTPTGELIGDFQGVSNIEAGELTYLHELWFKQNFGALSVSVGLQDLAVEFAVSEYGGLFVNSSFGTHSTIADNVPSPIFPLTALGVQVNLNMNENASLKAAVYDGLPDDFKDNPYNLHWRISRNEGLLSIVELNYMLTLFSLPASYKLGSYYHNHSQSAESIVHFTNNYGFYFVADHILYDFNDEKLMMFTQFGVSPSTKNDNYFYFGTGINYVGLIAKRKDDVLGFAIAFAAFNHKSYNYETAIELSYKAILNENISLQPDIQYILNPSGTVDKLKNPLIAAMRFGLNF